MDRLYLNFTPENRILSKFHFQKSLSNNFYIQKSLSSNFVHQKKSRSIFFPTTENLISFAFKPKTQKPHFVYKIPISSISKRYLEFQINTIWKYHSKLNKKTTSNSTLIKNHSRKIDLREITLANNKRNQNPWLAYNLIILAFFFGR